LKEVPLTHQINIILVVSIWLAFMGLGISLPIKPSVVKITRRLVCPSGSEMHVDVSGGSQKSIHVYITDENGNNQTINGRAFIVLWGIYFLISLPISAFIVRLVYRWINSL
jgi:hypothetical protein